MKPPSSMPSGPSTRGPGSPRRSDRRERLALLFASAASPGFRGGCVLSALNTGRFLPEPPAPSRLSGVRIPALIRCPLILCRPDLRCGYPVPARPHPEEAGADSSGFKEAVMSIFDHVQNRYARVQQEELSLEEYRSEEHTSELQSRPHLVCRLLLEKK